MDRGGQPTQGSFALKLDVCSQETSLNLLLRTLWPVRTHLTGRFLTEATVLISWLQCHCPASVGHTNTQPHKSYISTRGEGRGNGKQKRVEVITVEMRGRRRLHPVQCRREGGEVVTGAELIPLIAEPTASRALAQNTLCSSGKHPLLL